GWRRYAVALAAWLAITFAARTADNLLVSDAPHLWHASVAKLDIVGTIRESGDLPDDTLRADLAGTPLLVTDHIQAAARATYPPVDGRQYGGGTDLPALWESTRHVLAPPTTDAERDATAAAWKRIVLGHPGAYLAYRAHVFRELVHFFDGSPGANAYVAFIDINAHYDLGHAAAPSKLQSPLRDGMYWLGQTFLFRPWLYLALLLVALPFVRTRAALALALSGL